MLRVSTLSLVVGGQACDACCPFCVSRMTGFHVLPGPGEEFEPHGFEAACLLAQQSGTTTVLLTGKGEPLLYPDVITSCLEKLGPYRFPLIELQTNALRIGHLASGPVTRARPLTYEHLLSWRRLRLGTIAISTVGIDQERNAGVYGAGYPDLARTVGFLREQGFTVRLCVMMMRGAGYVSSTDDVRRLLDWCREHDVGQLSLRPIRRPSGSHDPGASAFVAVQQPTDSEIKDIRRFADGQGTLVLELSHGARIYDVDGQNLCLTDCLTGAPGVDGIRTLILYADGRIAYSWQHDGALLRSGRPRKEA